MVDRVFRVQRHARLDDELRDFSQITFAFTVTPQLAVQGLVYALILGFIGGLLPSLRAARLPIGRGLREL